MARTVPDLARLLSVMAGYDARLPFSIDEDPAAFAEPLKRDVKGLRLAWFGDLGGHLPMEPGILDLCRSALKVFEDMGCVVEEVVPDFDPERIWQAWLPLRHWQTGAPLLEFFRDPEKRARMKPEGQWEIEEGLKLSAYDIAKASSVRSASGACSSATTIGSCRPRRCSLSTLRPTGRTRSPAAGWTPITAGWRW
jgi:amidase